MLHPLEPPATPIMLYVGAGFDLSPLLTFAPHGSTYPIMDSGKSSSTFAILRQTYTYSSFIFVDAKPRHTSAFMVPDFEKWTTNDSRAKNVIHYSQGTLNRWRLVEDAPDLIIFEGGGSEELILERLRDENWHFSSSKFLRGFRNVWLKKNMQVIRKMDIEKRPLTTVYYLFNTLDIEMIRAPRMESLWSKVEALYVHGLKIHPSTGNGGFPLEDASRPLSLGQSLKKCFVLVGSWDGKSGVKQVDFVKQAQERLWKASLDTPAHQVASSSTCACSSESGTLYHSPASSLLSVSSLSIYFNHPHLTQALFHNGSWHAYKGYESGSTLNDDSDSNSLHECECFDDDLLPLSPPCDPFHILIPQIAYSPKLRRPVSYNGRHSKARGKKGAYYIARTLGECLEMIKGEGGKWSGEDTD